MADVQKRRYTQPPWAIGDWHTGPVGALLRRNGIDPEAKDIRGQAQLSGL